MTNPHGQAGRFAYDPVTVVGFLDAHQDYRDRGWTGRNHGSTISRWRRNRPGVTIHGLARVLACYTVGEDELHAWAKANHRRLWLRKHGFPVY